MFISIKTPNKSTQSCSFGMPQPARSVNPTDYRFGYNGGSEKDIEINNLDGTILNTEFRLYDTRLGRWFSIDPLDGAMPDWSPYHYSFNNPIYFNDPSGMAPPQWLTNVSNWLKRNVTGDLIATGNKTGGGFNSALKDIAKGALIAAEQIATTFDKSKYALVKIKPSTSYASKQFNLTDVIPAVYRTEGRDHAAVTSYGTGVLSDYANGNKTLGSYIQEQSSFGFSNSMFLTSASLDGVSLVDLVPNSALLSIDGLYFNYSTGAKTSDIFNKPGIPVNENSNVDYMHSRASGRADMGSKFTAQFVVKGFRQNRTDAILNPNLPSAKGVTATRNRMSFDKRNTTLGLPQGYRGHQSFWNTK